MKLFFLLLSIVSACTAVSFGQQGPAANPSFDKNVKIRYKPRPSGGDGQDCSQGTVILRIEFLSSRKIGRIFVVKGMTKNRTDESLKAAEKIRFRPAMKFGKAITVFRQVEFPFSLY